MEIIIIILLIIIVGLFIWDRLRAGGRWKEQSDSLASTLGARITETTAVFGDVRQNLGTLIERTQHIQEVSRSISSLLGAPTTRGGLGEQSLELLLTNALGPQRPQVYERQYQFRNRERVDAVVWIGENMVPIDAKFPKEDFERLAAAVASAQPHGEQEKLKKDFARAVKNHVDKVAKYIRPDEKTFDFALMYVPAENIYYEMICQDDICSSCMQKKVFLVSPTSFYAYLQLIVLGLKGLRIERSAGEIRGRLERLKGDFGAFQRDYEVLGGHISDASTKYDDASRKLTRFGDKLQIVDEAPGEKLLEDGTKTR